MDGDIGNYFCTAPGKENIWSTCDQEFCAKFGVFFVLKRALYGLKTVSNSFHIGFTLSRVDQDLWMIKLDTYDYDYIVTHVDDIIIAENNPSKYISDI